MKVTYTFDLDNIEENDDHSDLIKFQNVNKMVSSLSDLDDYRRSISKGWSTPTLDEVEEKLGDILTDSGYFDIE